MAKKKAADQLSRRERQIMEAIYQLGEASVGDVLMLIPDPPSYSAVRTLIRKIEAKGLLTHRQVGKRYVYRPRQSRGAASRSALKRLMDVFFAGSASETVAAVLDASEIDGADLDRIASMIELARKNGE